VRQERVRRRRRSEPESEPMLDVNLELFGYLRVEPA
jgi:hypothetical protein